MVLLLKDYSLNCIRSKCTTIPCRYEGSEILSTSIAVFKPVMTDFQQKHSAYKFQIAVDVIFHKSVDPAVVTQPPVALTSELVAVYADDAHPLKMRIVNC